MPHVPAKLASSSQSNIQEARAGLQRFLARRLGGTAEAKAFLGETLLIAIRAPSPMRRGETAPAWLERKAREGLGAKYGARDQSHPNSAQLDASAAAAWESAVRGCIRGLLPNLVPRYQEILRRVDLYGGSKLIVAREMGVNRATMDVLLHRARHALRRELAEVCKDRIRSPRVTVS